MQQGVQLFDHNGVKRGARWLAPAEPAHHAFVQAKRAAGLQRRPDQPAVRRRNCCIGSRRASTSSVR